MTWGVQRGSVTVKGRLRRSVNYRLENLEVGLNSWGSLSLRVEFEQATFHRGPY